MLALGLLLGLGTSASAALITLGNSTGSGEMYLWDIYNRIYGTNYDKSGLEALENDLAIIQGTFLSNSGKIYEAARYAGDTLTMKSYVGATDYDIVSDLAGGTAIYHPPGGVNTSDPDGASHDVADNVGFGVWGETDSGKWYSEKWRNSDGKYHFLVLNTPDPNRFLVCFEDKTDTTHSDWDYNDFVFETENIFATPEPSSMVLLGMGILGLFGLRRKV